MLILASASAARRALLRRAGVRFVVRPTEVRELRGRGRTLRETVLENARRKAAAVTALLRRRTSSRRPLKGYGGQGDRVLAADTMITYRGRIYGKPAGRKEAIDLLAGLAGKTHVIATGVVLRKGRRTLERCVETRVTLRALDRAAITRLVSRYDPTRFAGGYALRRNDPLIERIEGSLSNVMGLPVEEVLEML